MPSARSSRTRPGRALTVTGEGTGDAPVTARASGMFRQGRGATVRYRRQRDEHRAFVPNRLDVETTGAEWRDSIGVAGLSRGISSSRTREGGAVMGPGTG